MTFYPLEQLHRLHDGYSRPFKVAGRELLLLQVQGETYLIANRCPHMDAPLTHGTVQSGWLRCPLHGIEFDLQTGGARGGVAASLAPLEKFPLAYEGNQVGVLL
ncbi:Rieske 2Fe-2S domain-containing protein [Exilibacterium tricleocarpae]|uniref:Rieske 2Fe-2S domain-containing protein n=1 Tax=Exilibacterium tricleocarpae TaxID=2591008 RepID=A0A545T8I5_9GAMM|nr:Rieske 2Fe-2S domain-containing protein [Exilibacterium tricleocarpae]TQV73526.1 Rieske 2Fe-2S domain-containing protein [Exilibacterium tricleocarpae]